MFGNKEMERIKEDVTAEREASLVMALMLFTWSLLNLMTGSKNWKEIMDRCHHSEVKRSEIGVNSDQNGAGVDGKAGLLECCMSRDS